MSATDDHLAAARAFADQMSRLPRKGWDAPALGDWTLRQLVGHTSAAMTTIVDAVAGSGAPLALDRAAGYYALRRRVDPAVLEAALSGAALELAEATAALGPDPARTVREQLVVLEDALSDVDESAVVATPAGGMTLRDFLAVRTFELAVHALDVAAATGVEPQLPDAVLASAVTLAATTAVEVGDGAAVLRALTGRGTLPEGYTAL